MPAPQALPFMVTVHLTGAHSVRDACEWYYTYADALQKHVEVRGGSENASWQVGRTCLELTSPIQIGVP